MGPDGCGEALARYCGLDCLYAGGMSGTCLSMSEEYCNAILRLLVWAWEEFSCLETSGGLRALTAFADVCCIPFLNFGCNFTHAYQPRIVVVVSGRVTAQYTQKLEESASVPFPSAFIMPMLKKVATAVAGRNVMVTSAMEEATELL